jgi:hypothetical protein
MILLVMRYRKPVRFLSSQELDEAAREIVSAVHAPVAAAGGYAMRAYGSDRMTVDFDLVALRMPTGLPKLRPLTFGGYATRTTSGLPVDVIVRDDAFRGLYKDAVRTARTLPGVPVRVVSIGHLIAMKMVAGRAKDDLDLDFLLPRLTSREVAEARAVVVRHLGQYAGKEFDAKLEEARWKMSRDPEDRRRHRYRGKR